MIYRIYGYLIDKGDCVFGYDNSAKGIVVNEKEKEIINFMTKKYLKESDEQLPEYLEEYLSEKDQECKTKYGSSTIIPDKNIFNIQEEHKAILDENLWNKVQEKLRSRQEESSDILMKL